MAQAIRPPPESDGTAETNFLSTVVYRSRAVRSLTTLGLHHLTEAAKSRNRREAVTGVMLYDRGHFFQWLEGPSDSVDRIMESICNDYRHTDIEVISRQAAQTRAFSDWSLMLAAPGLRTRSWLQDVIEPPRDVVEGLHNWPEAAPSLLLRLAAVSLGNVDLHGALDADTPNAMDRSTAAILKSVMLSIVIPALAAKRGIPAERSRAWPVSSCTNELADLLIGSDQSAAVELIKELQGTDGRTLPLDAVLFEPAARRLGDLCSEDLCSESDVTLGLVRLQNAIRFLRAGAVTPRASMSRLQKPKILIAPEPGELHQLGAVMDTDVLRHAGWSPQCDYPADLQELQDLLSLNWFDALDLSLSVAFRRDHRLSSLTKTIAAARRASLNPALLVVVGGRTFLEDRKAGTQVGADLATRTAVNVDHSIALGINAAKAATAWLD